MYAIRLTGLGGWFAGYIVHPHSRTPRFRDAKYCLRWETEAQARANLDSLCDDFPHYRHAVEVAKLHVDATGNPTSFEAI